MASLIRKGDIILIACAALAAGVLYIFNALGAGAAENVTITADGAIWREVPLLSDSRLEFNDGDRYNLIVVQDATVRMEEANCPDKLCVKQGAVSDAHSVIVCLPNRLVIRLSKNEPGDTEVDVIVGSY